MTQSTLRAWKVVTWWLWPIQRWTRLRALEAAMFRLEMRMSLCQARIICLKRGYLAGDEPDLRSNLVLGRACINHPIKVIKVLLESYHNVQVDLWG